MLPLTITSALPAGSVSESQTQTVTFTFGTPVTGFNASDVNVTGATKGAFSGSGSISTLALTGTGGKVTVTVPPNVVTPDNPGANFSNFYQDTWTLSLPRLRGMEVIRIPAGTFLMGTPLRELSAGKLGRGTNLR